VVSDKPFAGFHQTMDYSIFERRQGFPSLIPITTLQVKAQISRPNRFEAVSAGSNYRVRGAAWSDSAIAKVDISSDGGKNWAAAELLGEQRPSSWRLWQYAWQVPAKSGRAKLMVRATDEKGKQQPLERDPDRRTYMINHVLPVEVEVN
jgi:Mo-co oxidoreductase dimerisation domain